VKKPQILTTLTRLWRLDMFVILLVVLVADLAARTSSLPMFHLDWNQFDVPYRSRIWWAAKDFRRLAEAPNLVLLGPSTMTCAMYGAESMFTRQVQCELLKHRSDYLEMQLKRQTGHNLSSFCLALPGQVPSDAYMIARTLLTGNRVPKAIFYGITARDFIDATFSDPSSTETFKVMSTLGHFPELQMSCRSSIYDRLNYQLGQLSFIYGHKPFLISMQHHLVQDALTRLDGDKFGAIHAPPEICGQAALQLSEDFDGDEVKDIYDPKHPLVRNNLDEYKARYRSFRPKNFAQQLAFFKNLVDYCHQKQIKLYVANMPITASNRNLIAPAVYAAYLNQTEKICRNGGAQYVDLDKSNAFVAGDFFDSIHLNGSGGEKLLDRIAQEIANGSQVASLKPSKPAAY
jgi:hypothetical protein